MQLSKPFFSTSPLSIIPIVQFSLVMVPTCSPLLLVACAPVPLRPCLQPPHSDEIFSLTTSFDTECVQNSMALPTAGAGTASRIIARVLDTVPFGRRRIYFFILLTISVILFLTPLRTNGHSLISSVLAQPYPWTCVPKLCVVVPLLVLISMGTLSPFYFVLDFVRHTRCPACTPLADKYTTDGGRIDGSVPPRRLCSASWLNSANSWHLLYSLALSRHAPVSPVVSQTVSTLGNDVSTRLRARGRTWSAVLPCLGIIIASISWRFAVTLQWRPVAHFLALPMAVWTLADVACTASDGMVSPYSSARHRGPASAFQLVPFIILFFSFLPSISATSDLPGATILMKAMNSNEYSGAGTDVWSAFLEYFTLVTTLFKSYPVFAPLFTKSKDKVTKEMNTTLYLVILFSTKGSARKIVLQYPDQGYQALAALRSARASSSIVDCTATVHQLFHFKINQNDSPITFFATLRNIFVALEEYDMPQFTETFMVSVMLNALPSIYDSLVASFSYQSEAIQLSQLESACLSVWKKVSTKPDSAFYTDGRIKTSKKPPSRSQLEKWKNTHCRRCGMKGHDDVPSGQCIARVCGNCGKGGHVTENCPNLPEQDEQHFITDSTFSFTDVKEFPPL